MWKWPWISRATHKEVVAAKDEVIAMQRGIIAGLRETLSRPAEITVRLPEDFAVIQPAFVRRPARARAPEQTQVLEKIDYASIDTKDVNQLAKAVAFQLGDRAKTANRWEKRQALRSVLVQVEAAREQKLRDRLKTAQTDESAEIPGFPQHLKGLIEKAERGEE